MDDYIKREDALKELLGCVPTDVHEIEDLDVIRVMLALPSADVVPVVRCKDCEHWDVSKNEYSICCHAYHNMMMVRSDGMGFCSDGERKDK